MNKSFFAMALGIAFGSTALAKIPVGIYECKHSEQKYSAKISLLSERIGGIELPVLEFTALNRNGSLASRVAGLGEVEQQESQTIYRLGSTMAILIFSNDGQVQNSDGVSCTKL